MSDNKYTIIEFIKYILSFFINRRKKVEEERKKRLQKTTDELQENFDKIDEDKEGKKKEGLGKRLNNMF